MYGASRMRMAHVISILCFVSRMRVEDRGPTNGIPLGIKMYWILYRFFSRAGVRSRVGGLIPSPRTLVWANRRRR